MTAADQQRKCGCRRNAAWGALLVLLTVVAYLPVTGAGFIWDDDWHITNNKQLGSVEGLRRIWFEPSRPGRIVTPQYYPMTHTTFWVEHHLWGDWAAGYHVDNVLLHAGGALLLWRVLVMLGVPGAWVAAAVWGVHPVMVESVAWASERKNVLSGVFYLGALYAYLRFAGLRIENKWTWYALAFGLFCCAVLSKTVTSTWGAAVLVIVWWKKGRIVWRDVVSVAPMLVVGGLMGSVTRWMERNVVGAVGAEWQFTFGERVMIASRAVWFYLGKVLAPVGLSFNYERWGFAGWQWVFVVAAGAVTAALWVMRRRIGRGALAGWLLFVGTLTPALGFFDVYPMRYSFVADHFQYLASAGLIAAVVAGVSRGVMNMPVRARVAGVGIVLAGLAGLTMARAAVFRSPESLWEDTLAKNPGSWLAHLGLERVYSARGDYERAAGEARAALALRPGDGGIASRVAMELAAGGRIAEARAAYREAVEMSPDNMVVRYNYGSDLARWGELEGAERELARAVELKGPAGLAGVAWENLGNVRLQRGDLAGAEEALGRAVQEEPGLANARSTLATLKLKQGNLEGGEREARRAVAEDPNLAEARNTLASALMMKGDLDGAERELVEALRLRPGFAQAKANLEKVRGARQAGTTH